MFWKILLHIWAYVAWFEKYLVYYGEATAWIDRYNTRKAKDEIGPPPVPPPPPRP